MSIETENSILWCVIALCLWFAITSLFDSIRDYKRQKRIDEHRYKEHKEIIDLIYFVKNELLTRHIEK